MILHLLNKGFLGLTSSRKGTLCLILFFCSMVPMTVLCAISKMDGTAYGICLSALCSAIVAIFCHTQSQTDQAAMATPTVSSIISTVETAIKSGPPDNLPISGVEPQ